MSAFGKKKSLIKKLEKSTLVDLATIGVLLFDAYVIYSLSTSYRMDLMTPASSPGALAIQLTGAAVALYLLEALADRVKSGGRGSSVLG